MEGRNRKPHESESTVMLLAISCYLILSEIPDSILYLLQPFCQPPVRHANQTLTQEKLHDLQQAWHRHYEYSLAATIIGTFSLTNYAVNILIYSLCGFRFRSTLFVLLRCHKEEHKSVYSLDASHVRIVGNSLKGAAGEHLINDRSAYIPLDRMDALDTQTTPIHTQHS